jgi:hypothetical protein
LGPVNLRDRLVGEAMRHLQAELRSVPAATHDAAA